MGNQPIRSAREFSALTDPATSVAAPGAGHAGGPSAQAEEIQHRIRRAREQLLGGRGPGASPAGTARWKRERPSLGGRDPAASREAVAEQAAVARGDLGDLEQAAVRHAAHRRRDQPPPRPDARARGYRRERVRVLGVSPFVRYGCCGRSNWVLVICLGEPVESSATDPVDLERSAAEQAALRGVATLVARGAARVEIVALLLADR